MIKRQTLALKNVNPITRAEGLRWSEMQARTLSRIKKDMNTSSLIRVNNPIQLIYDRTVRRTPQYPFHDYNEWRWQVFQWQATLSARCFVSVQLVINMSVYRFYRIFPAITARCWMKSQPVTRGAFCYTSINGAFESSKTRSLAHWTTVKRVAVSNAPHSVDELSSRASTRQSARGVTHYVLKENNFGELDTRSRSS